MKYAFIFAGCIISLSAYGMNEERQALVPYTPQVPFLTQAQKPVVDFKRERVESQLDVLKDNRIHQKDMNTARVIRAINSHSDNSGDHPFINWNAVVQDLNESSEIVADLEFPWMFGIGMVSAANTALFSPSLVNRIYNLFGANSGDLFENLGEMPLDVTCLVALGVATTFNGLVLWDTLSKLARKTGPHKGLLDCSASQALDFKTLKELESQDNPSKLNTMLSAKQFSEGQLQLIDHALQSSLLSNESIHKKAFKASLEATYPLSVKQCTGLLASSLAAEFASFIIPCVNPEPISLIPLIYNCFTMLAFIYLLRDAKFSCCARPQQKIYDEIITTINTAEQSMDSKSEEEV